MPQAPTFDPSTGVPTGTAAGAPAGVGALQTPAIYIGRQKTPAELFAEETATLLVNGLKFVDWETVQIQHRWTEAFPTFKFTTADRVEVPLDWRLLQFKPGDECAIYLGPWLAITGVITVRQVSYDANQHGVMLQGNGITWYANRASVIHPTGNFDGKSFVQVANEVIAPTGVGVKIIGNLDSTPFERLQVETGETIWNFLERIARPRGIVMGSDHLGNFLLIGDHTYTPVMDLVEGVNIKKAQITIMVEDIYSEYIARGQTAASDGNSGPTAAEQEARAVGSAARYSPKLTPAEQPVWNIAELQKRASNEAVWSEGTIIQATVTVQGWMRPSDGQLWQAGSDIRIWSPMGPLDMVLKAQTVTFMQSRAAGTETMLDLVAPWLLRDRGDWNVGKPVPGAAQPGSDPNARAAAAKTSVADPPAETLK
jgi:prophage tail gpP-like protein